MEKSILNFNENNKNYDLYRENHENKFYTHYEKEKIVKEVVISIAYDSDIYNWSHGEVTKSETINYKSLKPEPDGLFCEKIFGPVKDYECACGKYKKSRYKGIICERCGVEVTTSSVRRKRFGHISLFAPIVHIWAIKSAPSKLGHVLNIKLRELEEVIYFVSYIVVDPGDTQLKFKSVLDQATAALELPKILKKLLTTLDKQTQVKDIQKCQTYLDLFESSPSSITFSFEVIAKFLQKHTGLEFGIGADGISKILRKIDLKKEIQAAKALLNKLNITEVRKILKRLETLQAFYKSGVPLENMIFNVIPVIPPELRPIIQLDGGRFTTSDINDLYRRVILRNQRLKKVIDYAAPSIIINNERRMLQESVDALFDNAKKLKPFLTKEKRILKSLSENLRGKQGRFRQNLLGKRVDYSGRSVIVVGPDLKMNECGLPSDIALTLYKPFIIHELLKRKIAQTTKGADKLIQSRDSRIWETVDCVIQHRPVILNRAPTLHRLGVQAFNPKIINSKAITLHPLTTTAFNADFDGDQMAVHLPLSQKSAYEAETLLIGSKHILGLKDGKPIAVPSQDMILGIYYLTYVDQFVEDDIFVFSSQKELKFALDQKLIKLHQLCLITVSDFDDTKIAIKNKETSNLYLLTTPGKIIFNETLDSINYINSVDDINKFNLKNLVHFTDDQKSPYLTFKDKQTLVNYLRQEHTPYSPIVKKMIISLVATLYEKLGDETYKVLDNIKNLGFKYSTKLGATVSISDFELNNQNKNNQKVNKIKQELIKKADETAKKYKDLLKRGFITEKNHYELIADLWMGVKNKLQTEMEKLFRDQATKKNAIYMMVDSGARGTLANFTQLAGMRGLMTNPKGDIIPVPIKSSLLDGLTVSEFFISTHGARKGLADTAVKTADSGYLTRRLIDATHDVTILEDDCHTTRGYRVQEIRDTKTNALIVPLEERIIGRYSLHRITDKNDKVIIDANEFITKQIAQKIINAGIKEVEIRTVFGCNTSYGLCRKCYGSFLANNKPVEIGTAVGIISAQSIGEPGTQLTMRTFHTGGVADQADITQGLPRIKELFDATKSKGQEAIISEVDGVVEEITTKSSRSYKQTIVIRSTFLNKDKETESYQVAANIPSESILRVKVGDKVKIGQKLTDGAIDLKKLLHFSDIFAVQDYLLKEVQRVYHLQGIEIADKYIEIIVFQMLEKFVILDPGDSSFLIGSFVSIYDFKEENKKVLLAKKRPAFGKITLFGIKKAPLKNRSFLSSASFQDTTRVLTNAAIARSADKLYGIKENVMVGNLIPAGTAVQELNEDS
ncbi:DNA-directed RNA polymerase subunit beta' [Mycoplasma sp. SG1]|uniref:DNA-directed RNA polymerase subunit beta' n=1 Tax=Mycoplasma sp. SG1 TaxID=2810348 RepID=UPI002AFF8B9D|nr:DNA-directed RNA polymerase subunit beta' [Mycoplasma sp. SG1]URM52884.1 DNA-directed RNA polymerase subunit beta' [Mycoplasma sp. SG1]